MKLLATIKIIFRIIFNSHPNKSSLLWIFIKLKILSKAKLLSSNNPNKIKLFGKDFSFYEYRAINYLFIEIFIDIQYDFNSKISKGKIIDVGSNIGLSVLYFSKYYPDSEIFAFEPDPISYELLVKNIQNNAINAKAFRKALSDKKENLILYLNPQDKGGLNSSLLNFNSTNTKIEVEGEVLSNYINSTIDLLKLDAEGSEYNILNELDLSQKINKINNIVMEYHANTDLQKNSLSRILNIFEKNNFNYKIKSDYSFSSDINKASEIFIYAFRDENSISDF